MTLNALAQQIHATAKEKGWWDDGAQSRSLGDQFANFHAEISEAWEEYRKFGMEGGYFIYAGSGTSLSVSHQEALARGAKPEGIAVELADCIIRILDTCAAYDIPIDEALQLKLAYNQTRPHRHGGKQA